MEPDMVQDDSRQRTFGSDSPLITDKDKAAAILSPLRTYERDVADMIRKQQASVITVKLAEQRKEEVLKEGTAPVVVKSYARNALFAMLGLALVVLSALLFGFIYFLKTKNAEPEEKAPIITTLIPRDLERTINLSGISYEQLTRTFSDFAFEAYPDDSIAHINIVEGTTEARPETFFTRAAPHVPSPLTRAFNGKMFAGVYTLGANHPFFIVQIDSFDNAFAGMLAWEPNMYADLKPLITKAQPTMPIMPVQQIATSTATSTAGAATGSGTATSAPLFVPRTIPTPNARFSDAIIQNKDTRVLRNSQDDIILIYSFIDQHTLVIVDSESTLKEVIGRFTAAKLIR
jgi:hypothetical protein